MRSAARNFNRRPQSPQQGSLCGNAPSPGPPRRAGGKVEALPFVKLRDNDQPLWRPESYWNVRSTGEKRSDLELGRAYAREAIAAMKADRNTALINLILQDIINNAVARGGKNGRGRLSHLVVGFVDEISQAVWASADPE
jgi:hypothetical protein